MKLVNTDFIIPLPYQSNIAPSLTYLMPMVSSYTPWKQKNGEFLMFSGGIKRDQWHEVRECNVDIQMRTVHFKKLWNWKFYVTAVKFNSGRIFKKQWHLLGETTFLICLVCLLFFAASFSSFLLQVCDNWL